MRVLLLTPPMVQLNTPYPATAYLMGFLRLHALRLGLSVAQEDVALALFLRVFSRATLGRIFDELQVRDGRRGAPPRSEAARALLALAPRYIATVEPVVSFLQGRDPSLALRLVSRDFLPEGPRFAALDAGSTQAGEDGGLLEWAFGALGLQDRAKHLASLYLDDLTDLIRDEIGPGFGLSRYADQLVARAPTFDPLLAALTAPPSMIDELLDEITGELVQRHRPDLVGLTVPFPGTVYGALRVARTIKELAPATRVALGGGWVSTELRQLTDARVFDFVDYITLDDGEQPLLALLAHVGASLAGAVQRDAADLPQLVRTFVREQGRVLFKTTEGEGEVSLRDAGTPTYEGLPLQRYVSLLEMLNPTHRLWSDGRWNKLTVARGCYWRKCAFCDLALDGIRRLEVLPADLLVDRMETLIAETGQRGFHFVDEAAPPAALRAMAQRLLERELTVTWWGNIRFERAFTPQLAELLARSGCVAVSGGLEVASDRLLKVMDKGVTVVQVARVTRALTDAGIMVHAYLMYGFPTQTEQETVDALERVRQLFEQGCLQSAYWHRFAATVHSPIGQHPERFGIHLAVEPVATFARNEVDYIDPTGCDHDRLGVGLHAAVHNYMHGLGLERDVRDWFEPPTRGPQVPRPNVDPELIQRALAPRGDRRRRVRT